MTQTLNVYVYGSCVSRDVTRVCPEHLTTAKYIARQSWASAASLPTEPPSIPSKLDSPFQNRMVINDIQSSFPRDLLSNDQSFEVLLLDLVDERLGLVASGPSIFTDSYELRGTGWKPALGVSSKLDFGTDEHFNIWATSAEKLIKLLDATNNINKTRLIRSKYAARANDGYQMSERMRTPPDEWNNLFARYYSFAEELGFPIIEVPDEYCIASQDHTWGLEAFHYVDEFYQFVAGQLSSQFFSEQPN